LGKLRVLSGDEVCQILAGHGFAKGTLRSIIRQSGIDKIRAGTTTPEEILRVTISD
jgi:predicted RNA binding protein YcfA (HicA-like mRNA interferase family)